MYVQRRYPLVTTLLWSRWRLLLPLAWAGLVTGLHALHGPGFPTLPMLPVTLVGTAVAFYLGFKNSASYDRLWEARKIWGGIVNASRTWAISVRDLVVPTPGTDQTGAGAEEAKRRLVLRHLAWLDALRHALRACKSWEHATPADDAWRRRIGVVELGEDLEALLAARVGAEEAREVLGRINAPAHLLANQSRDLAELRAVDLLDGFTHMQLMNVLTELTTQQGRAERIKNFPFPRQYATVNSFFAALFVLLLPFGMLGEFASLGGSAVWLNVPFAGIVSWVFLATDKIGDASENPFEGLHNDVPITTMVRGIERDVLQIAGFPDSDLPEPRKTVAGVQT